MLGPLGIKLSRSKLAHPERLLFGLTYGCNLRIHGGQLVGTRRRSRINGIYCQFPKLRYQTRIQQLLTGRVELFLLGLTLAQQVIGAGLQLPPLDPGQLDPPGGFLETFPLPIMIGLKHPNRRRQQNDP